MWFHYCDCPFLTWDFVTDTYNKGTSRVQYPPFDRGIDSLGSSGDVISRERCYLRVRLWLRAEVVKNERCPDMNSN